MVTAAHPGHKACTQVWYVGTAVDNGLFYLEVLLLMMILKVRDDRQWTPSQTLYPCMDIQHTSDCRVMPAERCLAGTLPFQQVGCKE